MHEDDLKYLSEFLEEFQAETDRGAALVGAALLDERLARLIRSHMCEVNDVGDLLDSGSAPLGTLSARIKLAYCLGLITKIEFEECNAIRKIRNAFAHHAHGLRFSSQEVSKLCEGLRASTPDGGRFAGDPRQLFVNSVILTSLALWYRPEHAREHRCQLRSWDHQLVAE